MQDLNDKINDGGATADGQLSASEWNQLPSEIQSMIESAGITLSGGDLTQLTKAIAQYAVVGQFATGGGAVNAYTASVIAPSIAPPALKTGMIVRTIINNTNTGASTLNAFGLGVVDIKLKGGVTNPSAGDLVISEESVFTYRTAPSTHWELTSHVVAEEPWVANDSRAKTALNATGTSPIYADRAWVKFNGSGTPAAISSGNVSSITDNGVGSWDINTTNAMSTDSCPVGTARTNSSANVIPGVTEIRSVTNIEQQSSTVFRVTTILVSDTNVVLADADLIHVKITE